MNLTSTPRGRAVLFALLYASEGAPIGFIWWALPTLMRERGGDVGKITTVLAAVSAMWAVKFLWAPVVDVLRDRRWGYRSWILSAQTGMALALLPLAWLDPVADIPWLLVALIAHAFCATVQDVAIDALAIHVVPREDLGRINGFMAAGKYFGRGLFGGVTLIVAATLGWAWIIVGMVCWIGAILLVVRTLPQAAGMSDLSAPPAPTRERFAEFLGALGASLRKRMTWLAIGFALIAGAGFEAVGALTGTYLPDSGISTEETGWFRAIAVLGAMLAGSLLGGVLTDRWGVRRGSAIFLVSLFACIVMLGVADLLEAANAARLGLIVLMYLGYGMFIAATYALFMSLTDHRLAATQFSLFMAATNGCEVWSGWAGGQVVEHVGYAVAFLLMGAVSLVALPMLGRLHHGDGWRKPPEERVARE